MDTGQWLLPSLGAALALLLGRAGLHWAIRRGLQAPMVPEQGSPGDLGLPFRECTIAGPRGKRLFAWMIPAATAAAPTVAVLHGWGGNAEMMLPLAAPLHRAGYAVLLLDARSHGRSEADTFASLPRFAEDLEAALDWLPGQPEADGRRLAVLGHSVGAGAALLVASRRDDLAAAVSVAAFAHPAAMMRRWLRALHIPYLPLGWYILRYVERTIGYRFDAIAPIRSIARARCPVLLVHGDADDTVPLAEARAILAARGDTAAELLVVPGSHDSYGEVEEQMPRLLEFLAAHLHPGEAGPAAPGAS